LLPLVIGLLKLKTEVCTGLKTFQIKWEKESLLRTQLPDLEPVTPPSEELEVVSVSAITGQVIPAGIETELKFLVNGKEELTAAQFAEKYGEEGYTVEFKYNFNANAVEKAGKVSKDTDFKYAVQVEDAEGNLIPETVTAADFVDVKVVAASAATKVNSVALYTETEEWTAATVAESDKMLLLKPKSGRTPLVTLERKRITTT